MINERWLREPIFKSLSLEELTTRIAQLQVQNGEYHLLAIALLHLMGSEVKLTDDFLTRLPLYELIAERDNEHMCTTYRLKAK
jgi:hypothetical protein